MSRAAPTLALPGRRGTLKWQFAYPVVLDREGQEDSLASFHKIFSDHPNSVGETYLEHARHALSFGCVMLVGSLACFTHGVFPWLHTRTGSETVTRLYDRMVINRRKSRADEMSRLDPADYIAENI